MPHFNADTASQLRNPVTFTLGGTEYSVIPMTDEVFDEIEAIAEIDGLGPVASVSRQLALLTNTDPEAFAGIELRKLMGPLNFIMENSTDPMRKASRGKGRRG